MRLNGMDIITQIILGYKLAACPIGKTCHNIRKINDFDNIKVIKPEVMKDEKAIPKPIQHIQVNPDVLTPEKILDTVEERMYLMKWEGVKKSEWLPASLCREKFPH